MGILYSIFGFLLAIAILVTVHEFGHFWVARKLGVKVLRFSVGFGKPLWKKVAGEDQIEYVIGAIPLGGYVKMLGQGDASALEGDQDYVSPDEAHRAFDNQPIWKRSLIVVAGPAINFLFAIILFMFLGFGTEKNIVAEFGQLPPASALAQAGVLPGDKLLSIDGKRTRHLYEHDLYVFNQVLKRAEITLEVESAGQVKTVVVPTAEQPIYNIASTDLMRELGFRRIAPPKSTELRVVSVGSPAEKAGLKPGDKFVKIDGQRINTWRELSELVTPAAGRPLPITMERDGVEYDVTITPESVKAQDKEVGRLGVGRVFTPYPEHQIIEFSRSPWQALAYGTERTWLMSTLTLRMLWKMVTLKVSHKNISGPITIADVAGQAIQINWASYIGVLAFISISLGVMNLLPIPMLDGGHLLMYAVEIVAGQNVAEKVFAVGQRVGVMLLLCLMSLAFYNDIFRILN